MDLGLEALIGASAAGRNDHRPEFFRLTSPEDADRLKTLLERTPGIQVFDELASQLNELVRSLNPKVRFTEEVLRSAVHDYLKGSGLKEYGVWVFYPWSRRLVHLLDEVEFGVVRTDRNRNKITREEQEKLGRLKIGVIGLSVGQSVSMTMASERSFGEIRLADFDRLDLSNLNRIRTGTQHLGINKVIIVAREIAELDPYLKVTCFTEGLTKDNMDAFFTEGGVLDMVVEECDSVDIKILSRQKAKELRIPVVMDMSDRGCLDVERFDLEPERPLMHGWIDHLDLTAAGRPMTAEEKVPYMLPISGVETLSPRMKASVIELGQSLNSWPQLATSVVLGGALAGDVVRRIALDEFRASGRWFIDLDELIADGHQRSEPRTHGAEPLKVDGSAMERIASALGDPSGKALELGEDVVRSLIEAGALAPSAGNVQPWKFLWHERRLLLFHDASRSASFWDPDHFIAHVALGTCMENIVLKAHALSLEVVSRNAPDPSFPALIAAFEFAPKGTENTEPHPADGLSAMIGVRCTNRKVTVREPLPGAIKAQLIEVVGTVPGCSVQLAEEPDQLAELAALCGDAERIRVVNPIGHSEFFKHELRWTSEDAERTRDGLDLATMELSLMDTAGLRIAADPRAMELVDGWRAGQGLARLSGRAIQAASAVALISVPVDSISARLAGGRAVERLWMTANAEGWSVHPVSAPIFLTHALRSPMDGLRAHEREELSAIEERFQHLWRLEGRQPIFMVRLSRSGQPSTRSLRLPLEEVLVARTAIPA